MANIIFPKYLQLLLKESELQAPLMTFANKVGQILVDNKLTFFPDFTDHGIEHVNNVLKTAVELVPLEVREISINKSNQTLLCDVDAAVIIGATLLHDLAMHMHSGGFLELISKDSLFQPLSWFNENHEGHTADRPWYELWGEYVYEARRLSDRDLANIIGEESAFNWKFQELPVSTGQWEKNHFLIIGEFIRRHHARLAHEIALYGFPGLKIGASEGHFPAIGKDKEHPLNHLADLIGLTARSHAMSLRVSKMYLESRSLYQQVPRPMGCAILYPMALLRVADYLQIDRQRAPTALLRLRNPQSPVSIREWEKHRAVLNIGPSDNPNGKVVTVSEDLSLSLFLQLNELLDALQAEMDHSTAVLDEAYGRCTDLGLDKLKLVTRRIYSNLQSLPFREKLPYVPERTGFTVDPNLLTVLVEPLYGTQPSIGVRELMQNAVDAVRELEIWCGKHRKSINLLELPEQEGDVLIEFIKRESGTWFLRVRDRGIGMRSGTIQNYFLRAGASFRRSEEWQKEFNNEDGVPRVIRTGHFGIGVFAIFLLGHSFRMWTRHADVDKSHGFKIEATADSHLIEIQRSKNLPIGTTIEVDLNRSSVDSLKLENSEQIQDGTACKIIDWYCWDWPKVVKRIVCGSQSELLAQEIEIPIYNNQLSSEWAVIHPKGFDAVYWTFNKIHFSCNGIRIGHTRNNFGTITNANFEWPWKTHLHSPSVAILDSAGHLPLTIQRTELINNTLPFINELVRDVILSFIAHALICGPKSYAEALSLRYLHPLLENQFKFRIGYGESFISDLKWCFTSDLFIPIDPWLYSLLNTESYCVFGGLGSHEPNSLDWMASEDSFFKKMFKGDISVICLNAGLKLAATKGVVKLDDDLLTLSIKEYQPICAIMHLIHMGLMKHNVIAAQGIFSVSTPEFRNYFELIEKKGLIDELKIIKKTPKYNRNRTWFEIKKNTLNQSLSLEVILQDLEDKYKSQFGIIPDVLFVSHINTEQTSPSPKSLIAKIWYECLGKNAIPFNNVDREMLINRGRKHDELNRHINAWMALKSNASKYVQGSNSNS
ncbi:MAG: hypothetical protein WCK32_08505 [Chlorobiaceae bacterium]